MSRSKPNTAIARLLDGALDMFQAEGADIGVAETEAETKEKKKVNSAIKNVSLDHTVKSNTVNIQEIDPNQCRPWRYADRPEDEMGDIDQLAASIKQVGQQEPILIRPIISGASEIKYEVIFGNRRWRACKQANMKVLAIIKQVTDQEAALFQKEENESRKDLSDLARARSYKLQIEAGIFESETELSKTLGISRQNLNDIMAFNRIPEELANAIPNLKSISRKTAVKIAVLARDKELRRELLILATRIGAREITASNIEKHLKGSTAQKQKRTHLQFVDVKNSKGSKIFSLQQNDAGETIIKINKALHGNYEMSKIKDMLYAYLTSCE